MAWKQKCYADGKVEMLTARKDSCPHRLGSGELSDNQDHIMIKEIKCQTILILLYGGGGENKPLTNSLKTLRKNSTPKTLHKNAKKIQFSIKLDSKFKVHKKSYKTISKIGIAIISTVLLSKN